VFTVTSAENTGRTLQDETGKGRTWEEQ